jgi:hypothetical protein
MAGAVTTWVMTYLLSRPVPLGYRRCCHRILNYMERVCENCAREDDDLVVVRRLYVVPGERASSDPAIQGEWDRLGSVTRLEETELWCFSCRSQYPNEMVE